MEKTLRLLFFIGASLFLRNWKVPSENRYFRELGPLRNNFMVHQFCDSQFHTHFIHILRNQFFPNFSIPLPDVISRNNFDDTLPKLCQHLPNPPPPLRGKERVRFLARGDQKWRKRDQKTQFKRGNFQCWVQ